MISRDCQTAGAIIFALLLLCCGLVSSSLDPLKSCDHCHDHAIPSRLTPTSPVNQSPYTDCTTNFTQLERALLETNNNRYELVKAFYPPQAFPSVYVDIEYRFGDDNETVENWIWAASPFYYIHPPWLALYTTLGFAYPIDQKQSLSLNFPADCRVPNESIIETKHSRCGVNPMLDVLTQRLQLYAQYNGLFDVVVTETLANAVCVLDLKDRYIKNTAVKCFSALTVILPFIVVPLIALIVRSLRIPIRLKLMNPQNHASLVAIVLTGVIFSFYILIMDIAALVCVFGKHELYKYDIQLTSSKVSIFLMTFFDLLITFVVTLGTFIIYCHNACCTKEGSQDCFVNCCFRFFCCIFPDQNVPTEDEKKLWILTLLLIAPLVCLASHAGYIIIAWISDPQHASSATFIALLSFFYYFISFRQLYTALRWKSNFCKSRCCQRPTDNTSDVEGQPLLLPEQTKRGTEQAAAVSSEQRPVSPREEYVTNSKAEERVPIQSEQGHEQEAATTSVTTVSPRKEYIKWEKTKAKFDMRFCICEIFFGIVLVSIEVFVIYAIGWLPFRSTAASVDIFRLLQLSLLALAILITYKILVPDDSLEHRLMRSIAEANEQAPQAADDEHRDKSDTDTEYVGMLLGQLVYKYKRFSGSPSRSGFDSESSSSESERTPPRGISRASYGSTDSGPVNLDVQ